MPGDEERSQEAREEQMPGDEERSEEARGNDEEEASNSVAA